MPKGKSYSSKSNEEKIKKAMKEGKISKKQFEKLPESLLMGIVKRGDAKGGVKEKRVKSSGKVGRPKAGSNVEIKQ